MLRSSGDLRIISVVGIWQEKYKREDLEHELSHFTQNAGEEFPLGCVENLIILRLLVTANVPANINTSNCISARIFFHHINTLFLNNRMNLVGDFNFVCLRVKQINKTEIPMLFGFE